MDQKIVYTCQVDPRPVICFLIIPRRFREHLKEYFFEKALHKSQNKIKVGGRLLMEETFSFALLLFLHFPTSVRNEKVLYIFTL